MGAVPVHVNNDATFEVANSTPALSSTSIINNSTATTGLIISGDCLEIKSIDGSGSTQVTAGADVTTDHIIQNALLIGGTGANPALLTIDASDSFGNPLSQGADELGRAAGDDSSLASGLAATRGLGDAMPAMTSILDDPAGLAAVGDGANQGTSAVPEPSAAILLAAGFLFSVSQVLRLPAFKKRSISH
jgi:hypothetical protein